MTKTLEDDILDSVREHGEKKKEKPVYTAKFDDLVDLVANDHEIKFLTFDGQVYGERILDEKTYIPPKKVSWLLPRLDNILEEVAKHSDRKDSTVQSDSRTVGTAFCNYCDKELYPLLALDYFPTYSKMPTEYHYDYL